jgi:sulfite oxidase
MESAKPSVSESAVNKWKFARSRHEPVHNRAKTPESDAAPSNVAPPQELLLESFVTPEPLFFVRNHGNVPHLDAASYRLTIDGRVRSRVQLSLADLRKRFAKQAVPATIACAGLRRKELLRLKPIPAEISWDAGVIGNAEWGGVPLREVLYAAGLKEGAHHASFIGLDEVEHNRARIEFGGSIPICKALCPEVLLAYEMNGEPLTPEHGFPLRVVVPGYFGARSVKWLAGITLQDRPSENYFQAEAYRLAPKNGGSKDLAMPGMQITNAVITSPMNGELVKSGSVAARGFALSGGGRKIERVEISTDGGQTWTAAALTKQSSAWSWCFWETEIALPRGRVAIIARAWDSAGETQPASADDDWNPKGSMNNCWHFVKLIAE